MVAASASVEVPPAMTARRVKTVVIIVLPFLYGFSLSVIFHQMKRNAMVKIYII
jgi:hypothetical protein